MPTPPRPYLSKEELAALTDEEKKVAIAEWSSYNARLRQEQELARGRGTYRGVRARGGRGRGGGRGYYAGYQPYPPTRPVPHLTATFNRPGSISTTPSAPHTLGTPNAKQPGEQAPPINTLCAAFTSTGVCKRPKCRYLHDPDKTAICKQFLFKGDCRSGDKLCPLSHEPSPNRSPHCIHFERDQCNKDDCRYSHVHVSIDAPVCEAFARLGYCEKGGQCLDRHAFECPDFTNKGACEVGGCRLPHVVHAARLRKARMSSEASSPPSDSDSEQGNAEVVENADNTKEVDDRGETDDMDETDFYTKADNTAYTHDLSQQVDFIHFEH